MTLNYAWTIVLASIGVTYLWRALGVALSSKITPEGALYQWVTCVSYAMLAGLIARMTVLPLGELASLNLSVRLGAMGVALLVYFSAGRHMLAAVGAGVLALVAMAAIVP